MFRDTSVNPSAAIQGSDFALDVEHLDTASAKQDADYRFSADLSKYGHVDSTGRVAPLSANGLNMSTKAHMRSLALGPLSGYMNAALGRGIQRGTADGDLELGAKNGALDGKLDVTLSNFQLANSQSKQTNAALGVSLGTAIALTRSDDDTIDFSTNISGNAGSPSFSILNVVRQAIFAGLRKSVTSTYSPLGLIGDAAESLSNIGQALSFHAIVFDPGEHTLTDDGRKYLQQIGTAMSKQPGLSLTLTGHAVPADADSMSLFDGHRITADNRDQLRELARARAEAVHDYLAARGIKPARLRVADAAIDKAGNDKPQVKLALARDQDE